jgi:hypothetical protein
MDRLPESRQCIRWGIRECYRKKETYILRIAVWYSILVWTYLRDQDFKKAEVIAKRLLKASTHAGWLRGQLTAHLVLAVITEWQSSSLEDRTSNAYFKIMKKFVPVRSIDTALDQLEFVHKVLCGDYPAAEKIILYRLKASRPSRLHFAHAILDALCLSKLHSVGKKMRPSHLEFAQEIFSANGLNNYLLVFQRLQQVESLDRAGFINLYRF